MRQLLRLTICCLMICCTWFVLPSQSAAEGRTISWSAVTTYTDNTPILPTEVILYDIYWHTTTDFLLPGIHTIVIGTQQTSKQFDAVTEGLPRNTTVYFTGKARLLSNNATSEFAPAYPWLVPPYATPGKPSLNPPSLKK